MNENKNLKQSILILDDDPLCRISLCDICSKIKIPENQHLEIITVSDFNSCMNTLKKRKIDVILLDKNLKESNFELNSLDKIDVLLHQQPNVKILVITGDNASQDIVTAIKKGAFGFIRKDEPTELLVFQLQKALEVAQISTIPLMNDKQFNLCYQIGARSEIMNKVLLRSRAFAQARRPVLILGETGTGKTLLAKYIHAQTFDSNSVQSKTFISINLSALPVSLLERELFGSEKGAFTDSKERKQGYFELANGGTLFLDEIGEISPDLQVKLLKVIEEKSFYRLGGDRAVSSDFKLICATNRDLEDLVKKGLFREDLYMRVSTFQIAIPPLSERREDILPIVEAALPRWAQESQVQIAFEELPDELLEYLSAFNGRGNVRGLEQLIFRIFALTPKRLGGKLDLTYWREALELNEGSKCLSSSQKISLKTLANCKFEIEKTTFPGIDSALEQFESKIYDGLFQKCESSRELATVLKTSPATVSVKLKRFGLKS